eukprot:5394191-Amphidinium_carterae.1
MDGLLWYFGPTCAVLGGLLIVVDWASFVVESYQEKCLVGVCMEVNCILACFWTFGSKLFLKVEWFDNVSLLQLFLPCCSSTGIVLV